MNIKDCIFCKIIDKTSPADIVFEDKYILALKSIEPISNGHTLVIPKIHCENIFDIENDILEKLISVSKKLSKELCELNNATGVNLLNASGIDAQQSIFHFHLHIVPRYPDDKLDLWFRSGL